MTTPSPPQVQGTNPPPVAPVSPYPVPPQYVPDPTGAYRKVLGGVSPFQMQMGMGQPMPPVSQETSSSISSDAVTRRMQRNEDQARRQQAQPPSPIASQSM